jgi:hypothetical protein
MRNDDLMKKKQYQKPLATRFPLRPDEAVLGFCKSSSASGPTSGNGCRGAVIGTCSSHGS